jgi:hypothetical protein
MGVAVSGPNGEPKLPDDYRSIFLSQVAVVTIEPPPRRNSPIVLLAVASMVLVGVLLIAVLGKVTSGGLETTVEGTALAVGETGVPRPRTDSGSLPDIAASPLFSAPAPPPIECELPELATTPGELDAYYRMGIACLDKAWKPVLTAAGLPFRSPGLNIDDNPRTKCGFAPGKQEATAFYCERDKVIYMPRDRLMRDAGDATAFHLAVLAHEYGHHVQALAGILSVAHERERAADEAEFLEVSRRTELQANCFAGVFLASVSGRGSLGADLAEESVQSFEETSATDTHGSRKNQLAWATAGFKGKTSGSCNTWLAPPAEVA